jgi:hypothetical protein
LSPALIYDATTIATPNTKRIKDRLAEVEAGWLALGVYRAQNNSRVCKVWELSLIQSFSVHFAKY